MGAHIGHRPRQDRLERFLRPYRPTRSRQAVFLDPFPHQNRTHPASEAGVGVMFLATPALVVGQVADPTENGAKRALPVNGGDDRTSVQVKSADEAAPVLVGDQLTAKSAFFAHRGTKTLPFAHSRGPRLPEVAPEAGVDHPRVVFGVQSHVSTI